MLMRRQSGLWMVLALSTAVIAGCGSNGTPGSGGNSTGPVPGESTQVTLVASSAANDRLTAFNLFLNSLTLTTDAGKTVSVISSPLNAEFIHLNGGGEPLLTVSVPQAQYVSATAVVGAASFDCEVLQSNSMTSSTYAYGYTPDAQVTVNLPKMLTIDGKSMTLALQLQASQSASFPSQCWDTSGLNQFEITPTFTLSAPTLSAQPTNWTNGKLVGLEGTVAAVNGSSITVNSNDGAGYEIEMPNHNAVNSNAIAWTVATNSSTAFQGTGNAEGLTAGMPVDFDAILQPDGSLLATRFAVSDPDTTNLTVINGPILQVTSSIPVIAAVATYMQGALQPVSGGQYLRYGNASFGIEGGMTNLSSLPFPASFSANNMVAGQMVSMTSHSTTLQPYPVYVPLTTVTLMPQAINGTVIGATTQGGFTEYTVQLAPYDIFPQFAVQPGQTTLLTNPNQVVVYADANTQVLATPAAGSPARFTGLIFNDNGTLRMDCSSISGGVTE